MKVVMGPFINFAEIGYWQVLSFGEKFWNRKRNELLTHECILIYLNIFCIIIAKKGKKSINDQIFSYITFLPNDHNSYNNLFFFILIHLDAQICVALSKYVENY